MQDKRITAFVKQWHKVVAERNRSAAKSEALKDRARSLAKDAVDHGIEQKQLGEALRAAGIGSYRSVRRLLTGK